VIRVLRLVGAQDGYIARAFVRRFTLRAAWGAAAGTAAACSRCSSCPSRGGRAGLLTGSGFQGWGWLAPLLDPPLAASRPSWPPGGGAARAEDAILMAGPIRCAACCSWCDLRRHAVVGLLYLPWRSGAGTGAVAACHAWCRMVRRCARCWRGSRPRCGHARPTGEVLIAAKHQSFLDIILIYGRCRAASSS
jgi:hypothetical protein